METLKLSHEDLIRDYDSCHLLAELIRALEIDIEKLGKVICRVKVNGLNLSENDEARLASTEVNKIETIEVETENIRDLTLSSLQTISKLVVQLSEQAVALADVFRRGDYQQAQVTFTTLSRETQALTDALMVTKSNLHQFVLPNDFLERWSTSEIHMVHTMRELIAAYEVGDWVLLSDVLEYELYNTLDKWRALLSSAQLA